MRQRLRISAFVVEKADDGLSFGAPEKKLGIKGSPTGSPVFEDVRVPEENVIGGVGSFMIVAENFEHFGRAVRTKLVREMYASPANIVALVTKALRP